MKRQDEKLFEIRRIDLHLAITYDKFFYTLEHELQVMTLEHTLVLIQRQLDKIKLENK